MARGTGTYGSKSTQIGGAAARQASEELVEKAKELAAEQLEADPDDMVLELGAGVFHVAGAPEPVAELGRPRRRAGQGRAARRAERRDRLQAAATRPSRSAPT